MSEKTALLSLDQGTTSSRAIIFSPNGLPLCQFQQEFAQSFPQPGWVEHDPEQIWQSCIAVLSQAIDYARSQGFQLVAMGITNQRETTLIWDKTTGKALYPAIVWQDRRTQNRCAQLREQGYETELQQRTGLLLDPYFSASKLQWLLDTVPSARTLAEQNKLAFGTVDCFLIWRLSGGTVHATDATNASRTSLYNLQRGDWDPELLRLFNIPKQILPSIKACSDHFANTDHTILGISLPICGVAGDQQAAAIGQGCISSGEVKCTHGTGSFMLLNTGDTALISRHRLLSTVAWKIGQQTHYGLEGSIFVSGASVQWLRDNLKLIQRAADTETLAASLDDNQGVYLLPAFTGLGAPHWQANIAGAIFGLTRNTGPAHLARASLESVAYQTRDLFEAMAADGQLPSKVKVDGGMVANNWLCQFMADICATPLIRPKVLETTALGAAFLAGLGCGLYQDIQNVVKLTEAERTFEPAMDTEQRLTLVANWHRAIQASFRFHNVEPTLE